MFVAFGSTLSFERFVDVAPRENGLILVLGDRTNNLYVVQICGILAR